MRVCIIVEGAYPYVTGGVSSWLHQMIQNMPQVEFIIQVISSKREANRKFKYEILPNVVEIQEIFLSDYENVNLFTPKKSRMNKNEYKAIQALIFGQEVDWKKVFDFFLKHKFSVDSILSGYDFFQMVASYHEENYSGIPFTDFLWSLRSMYMPLFTVLNANPIKADIYHPLSSGYSVILGSLQKELYKKPLFLTEHGIYLREREEEIIRSEWVDGVYKDLWINQFNKIGKCGYDYADVVSSLFEDAKQLQIELGCNYEKAVVLPNGVDIKLYENIPQKDKDDEFINLGAIARVARIKDLKTMLIAFSYAKEKNNKLKLFIMGPTDEDLEYTEECEDLIKRLNIKDVEFLGTVNIKDYIGKMDVLLLSSISEGQPLVILEAFAAKKPFVATNVGNCKGLIEGEFDDFGKAGRIVHVTDAANMAKAILEIVQDEDLKNKMGLIGYKRVVKYYDKNDTYKKYLDVYNSMINKRI